MKKTDIAMIILIATTSILVSFFAAKLIFGDVYNGTAVVDTIDKIESSVQKPDPEIFNKDAINPSVQVQIESGNSDNDTGTQ